MFDPTTILGFHTWMSLFALAAGLVLICQLITNRLSLSVVALFMVTGVITSASGFALPASGLLPSHVIGVISLLALGLAIVAISMFRLSGAWRLIFVVASVVSVYLDAFVAVAQAFMKVPALKAMTPTGAEPPFVIAQLAVLLIFIVLGYMAFRSFRPLPPMSA